jgi:hypothetical protein
MRVLSLRGFPESEGLAADEPSPIGTARVRRRREADASHTWPAANALCALPAAMVALERVQSGAHHPSDVATGAAIGLAGTWLTRRAPRLILRHWP